AKINQLPFTATVHTFGDDPSTWQDVFNKVFGSVKNQSLSIGVESTHLRFLEFDYLQKALPQASFVSAESTFGNLRMQKDETEISCMKKAVQIAQKALQATMPVIKSGISEQDVASELVLQLYKAGSAPELPFMPILASGPNSANPHAVPSNRKLVRGDLLVIDWGAAYEDYFSDLTRTFALGECSPELKKIHDTVKAANAAGRAAGKPGVAAGVVDSAARDVIEQAGYGRYFTHRTGHGLGMEAHEPPYMFGGNQLKLEKGMTYTVEPGIYLPELGGVRIEDDMVITENGCESLSDFPRELKIL
ncbi:MAG: aminopeptidase P family protein, partial [Saprospiraceae bacterium]|nr:aminopeptidase P family protein [Saprospiraceae bacterium]